MREVQLFIEFESSKLRGSNIYLGQIYGVLFVYFVNIFDKFFH